MGLQHHSGRSDICRRHRTVFKYLVSHAKENIEIGKERYVCWSENGCQEDKGHEYKFTFTFAFIYLAKSKWILGKMVSSL